LKCNGGEEEGCASCASLQEINAIVDLGNVVLVMYIEEDIFDPAKMYDKNSTGGVYKNVHQWRFYAVPESEQLTDMYMEGRRINVEERFIGSPPFPQKGISLKTFHNMATTYKKTCCGDNELMTFYFRLHPRTSLKRLGTGFDHF